MNIVSVFEMKGNQYGVGSHMALGGVYEAMILSMIRDIVQYFYGIPERDLNFTIFNSQLIHVIRQIKGEKKSIKLVQKPFSCKTRKDWAHKRWLESSKVETGSQCKAAGTESQEERLTLFTILNYSG